MGFYPVAPATDQYILGTPLFKKMTIHLQNGKEIVINAEKNSDENRYINKMMYNGNTYTKNWLSHKELVKGAVIDFDMTDTPNKKRGTTKEDYPYSLSNE